jgi:hypothetical protein
VHANQPRVIPNTAVCGGNVDASWRARNLDSKTAAALDQRFDGVITTETDLREIVGPANRWFTSKILNRLDRRCRDFIAASPFIVVGSTDPFGLVDMSPKGDSAGFVRSLDDTPSPFRTGAETASILPEPTAKSRRWVDPLCSGSTRNASRYRSGYHCSRPGY